MLNSYIHLYPHANSLPGPNDPLTYYSWHIHSYFFHENKNVTARAMAIREKFIDHFKVPTCKDECFMGG